MAAAPQPPTPGKGTLSESEPLKAYHGLMGPYFEQQRAALESLTLKENHGAVVTEPITVTAGADGAISGVTIPASFAPLLVFFRAETLDASKRPTGAFVGGSAQWSGSTSGGEQGLQVTKALGLVANTSYAVTFIALPG